MNAITVPHGNPRPLNLKSVHVISVFAFAVVLIFFSLSSGDVSANAYKVDICKDQNWLTLFEPPSDTDNWVVSGDCEAFTQPSAVSFWKAAESEQSSEVVWSYPWYHGLRRPDLRISAIRVGIVGDDGTSTGLSQGIRLCGETCGALISPLPAEESPGGGVIEFGEGSPQVPQTANSLQFIGRCLSVPCGPSRPFTVGLLELTYTDTRPPTIVVSREGEQPVDDQLRLGWMNGSTTLDWAAADDGSGVARVKISRSIGGPVAGTFLYSGCSISTTNARYCPASIAGKATLVVSDTGNWAEGLNGFHFQALDRSNQDSIHQNGTLVTLYADRRPPTPEGLSVDSETTSGWLDSPNATLRWRNVGETGEVKHGPDPASGVSAARYDLQPLEPDQTDPQAVEVRGSNIESAPIVLPGPGRWRITLKTIDGAGNESSELFTVVGVDGELPAAPEIEPVGWVGRENLLDRSPFSWRISQGGRPRSGICGYGVAVDESPNAEAPGVSSIVGDVSSAPLPAIAEEGSTFLHLRAISCAGLAGPTAHEQLSVDLTDPEIASSLSSAEWSNRHQPLSLTATDDRSGVESIHVSVDGESFASYRSDRVEPPVPDGLHDLQIFSRDQAGNDSKHQLISVGFDRTAPTGWFQRTDPARPTLVSAVLSDVVSGVADGTIEYRATGTSGPWISLPSKISPQGDGGARLTARFPDVGASAGRYELRALVVDRAGNSSHFSQQLDGVDAAVETPVRRETSVSFGFATRRRPHCSGTKRPSCQKLRLAKIKQVSYGAGARVTGRLVDKLKRPIAAASVGLYVKRSGRDRYLLRRFKSDSKGYFTAWIPRGVNRLITAHFGGDELRLPSQSEANLETRSKLTISVSNRRIRPGGRVLVTGRLITGGEPIPLQGIPIDLPVSGLGLSIEARVKQDGTYTALLGPIKVSRPTRIGLRARLREHRGWPYATGESRRIEVLVEP